MELPGSKRGKEEDLREDQCDRGGYYCMVDWGEFVGTPLSWENCMTVIMHIWMS